MTIDDIFDIPKTPPTVLEALPAEVLMHLQERAAAHMSEASKIIAILHDTMVQRYARGFNSTGTHHIDDGSITVSVTVPKKVKWDQATLAAAWATIAGWGEDPANYIDVAYSVKEAKYDALVMPAFRDLFDPARTVDTGKPVFKMAQAKREAA